jgi:hypothetical protein
MCSCGRGVSTGAPALFWIFFAFAEVLFPHS